MNETPNKGNRYSQLSGARCTHADLIYKDRHRKGWKTIGRRYPYKNKHTGCDERLSIPQIAARAGIRENTTRKYLNDWDWNLEKLFGKFGDSEAGVGDKNKLK